jgi:hypothetical protein
LKGGKTLTGDSVLVLVLPALPVFPLAFLYALALRHSPFNIEIFMIGLDDYIED